MADEKLGFWDRFVVATHEFYKSNPLLGRYLEQSGLPDIAEELARFDDEDMSLSHAIGVGLGTAFQTATQPLQMFGNLALEADRAAGAAILTQGRNKPFGEADLSPWKNYATSWTPPQWVPKDERTFEQAQGVFYGATAGGLLTIAQDRLIQNAPEWAIKPLLLTPPMLSYSATRVLTGPGPFDNGTYVPPAFDIYAPDIGASLADSDLKYTNLVNELSVEIAIDPLNWLASPIGAGLAGLKAKNLVTVAKGINGVSESLTDANAMISAAKRANVLQRLAQHRPGLGMLDQQGMINHFASGQGRKTAEMLAANKDYGTARRFWRKYADGSALDEVTKLSLYIDNPEDIIHLANAGAYRNVISVDRVKQVVDESTSLKNSLDTLLGTGDNLLSQVLVDMPSGSIIPDNHILRMDLPKFIDDALTSNPHAKAAWEALAAEDRAQVVTDFGKAVVNRDEAMATLNKAFGEGRVDQMITKVPARGLASDRAIANLGGKTLFGRQLREGISKSVMIPGGAHRFGMKFLFTSRPGLVFNLDAVDAGDKVTDYIDYVDHLVGSGNMGLSRWWHGRSVGNILAKDYSFARDPEVIRIRNAFWDAGAVTSNPTMLRAELMNELQTYALRKIAESSGYDAEVAQLIAGMGMDRARNINTALNNPNSGYMSLLTEDGVPVTIANHPTTLQQVPDFVPLMDLYGVRKALHSRPMRAYITKDTIASIAKSDFTEGYVSAEQFGLQRLKDLQAKGPYGTNKLTSYGRTQSFTGNAYHSVVDVLDVVNNTFKLYVLLRLGYSVRNLSEGALSAVGSGVGLTKILKNADLNTLTKNTGYNWGTVGQRAFRRRKDKFMTAHGFRLDEPTLIRALQSGEEALRVNSNQLADLIDMVSDPYTITALRRTIAESTDANEVVRARKALEFLTEYKHRLALHLQNSAVDAGLADPDTFDAAQRLYHADRMQAVSVARGVDNKVIEAEAGVLALDPAMTLQRPISLSPWADHAQANLDSAWTPFQMSTRRTGTKNPRPVWASRAIKNVEDGEKQWGEFIGRLEALADTHHIQYRTSPSGRWMRFDLNQQRTYKGMPSYKYEFRVTEQDPLGLSRPDRARVVAFDTWGPEADLTSDAGKQAITKFDDVDEAMVDAAMSGDRNAQDALSNVLARHGIYRARYTDNPEWGGINVIVHPDGIGDKALQAAVKRDIDAMISGDVKRLGADTSTVQALEKMPREVRIAANRGEDAGIDYYLPHVDREGKYQLANVLSRGGFEAIAQDVVATQVKLRRQQEGLRLAYKQRLMDKGALKKRAGYPVRNMTLRSIYGESELLPGQLSGIDSFKYRQLSSADATVSNTIGIALHRQDRIDDLRSSHLSPRIVDGTDPYYFESHANLLARYYRDQVGATTAAKANGGVLTPDDIDPVAWRALQPGDRERLYEDTVEWAIGTAEGRDWVRSMGLVRPGEAFPGVTADEIAAGKKAISERAVRVPRDSQGNPLPEVRQTIGTSQKLSYRRNAQQQRYEANVGELIADQFNFVDNYINRNPGVRDLFLSGEMTPDNLQALYQKQPWELLPLNGAHAPTSAEYRTILREMQGRQRNVSKATDNVDKFMTAALQKLGSQPETRLLRHPMFEYLADLDFQQRYTQAERMMGRPLTITERNDLAARARGFALKRMKETLYTLESRSTAEDYLRFISPFFPAWWNTASRWGRFYRRNPAEPAKIASRWFTVENSNMIVNENGEPVQGTSDSNAAFNTYLLLPFGVGTLPVIGDKINKMFPGADQAMNNTRIPLRSFDVVFQGDFTNPGFGPVVAVPMQWILQQRDGLAQEGLGKWITDKILPVGPEVTGAGHGGWDNILPFMPTALKRTTEALLESNKYSAQFNRNVQLLTTMRDKGQYEGDDNKLYDDAMELTKLMTTVKVMSALVSPVAQQQTGYPEYIAGQYREIQDKAIAMGHPELADDMFNQMFPADYLLTISSSFNLTKAASTSWATENQRKYDDIQRVALSQYKDPNLLWAVDNYMTTPEGQGVIGMATSDEYNPYSRAWQTYNSPEGSEEQYRSVKDAATVISEGRVKQGWLMYDQVEAAVIAQLVGTGLPEGSWEFNKQKQAIMSKAGDVIAQQNPVWGTSRDVIDTGRFSRNAEFFTMLINDEQWMTGKQDHELPKLWGEYLAAREDAAVAMAERGEAKTSSAKANADIAAQLELKAQFLSKDSPSFRLWYNRYFRNDVVNVDEVN